jgi:hypothetical protein
LLVTLGLLFVISFSKTKVSWYDAPLYPLFAVLFGLTFYQLQHKVFAGIVFCLLIILATIPYYKILNRNLHPQNEFDFPLALDYLRKERMISSPIKVFERHMMYPIHFYMVKDSLQGFCSTFDNPLNSHLKINDLVLTLTDEREKELIALYRTQKIDSYYNCTLHRIINVGNND